MTTDACPIIGPPIVTHRQAVTTFAAKRRSDNGYTVPALNSIFKAYALALGILAWLR